MGRLGAFASLLIFLSGCQERTAPDNWVARDYTLSEFALAARDRDLRIAVARNSYDIPDATLASIVAADMKLPPGNTIDTHFTATPGPSARSDYRIVWFFTGSAITVDEACRSAASADRSIASNTVTATAVFCRADKPLSMARGDLPDSVHPDGQAFADLIATLTGTLLPPRFWMSERVSNDHLAAVRH